MVPDDAAWQQRLNAIDPRIYALSRNHLNGAVSGLSPYFTHGYLSLSQALESLRQRTSLEPSDKLFAEFCWRAFFHHVWAHRGDAIFSDLRAPLPNVEYIRTLPDDIRRGHTGIAAIDQAVATLYATGYLHNHARMWLASYVVHMRHVHWRVGADWLYGHLLDGDLACNHLSWQWVARTFSIKPYLFNADNVAKYAPAAWHCYGTALDTSYTHLEAMAMGHDEAARLALVRSAEAPERQAFALPEPQLYAAPPAKLWPAEHQARFHATLAAIQPTDAVEWVHAWGLRSQSCVPSGAGGKAYRLGLVHLPAHKPWPWSERRWAFVLQRMQHLCDAIFVGDVNDLRGLVGMRAYARKTPGSPTTMSAMESVLQPEWVSEPPALLEPPELCGSFSKFYRHVTAGYSPLTKRTS